MTVRERAGRQAAGRVRKFVRHLAIPSALSAATLLAAACNGDQSVAPEHGVRPTPHAALSKAPAPDTCAAECALFTNVGPLRLAVARADSAAYHVPVSVVRVSGEAGDSIALHLDADDAVLSATGPDARVRVSLRAGTSTMGASAEFSLTAVRAGVTVARFATSETITVDVSLLRTVLSPPPTGIARLLQQHWGAAQVVSAERYFMVSAPARESSGGPSIAVIEDPGGGDGSFQVNASGTYGSVTVAIEPEWNNGPGEVFSGAFQSDSGTGASRDITVTFSEPVAFIGITVLDPTWDGNRVITYGPDGEVLADAGIPGSRQPGVNFPVFRSFAGSIARLRLVAAPNDYVAYQLQITLAAAELKLECLPAQVVRGESVRCEASVTPPDDGSSFTITEWSFVADSGDIVVTRSEEQVRETTWMGEMVASGTVTVRATVGGSEKTKAARIDVASRNWANRPTPAFPITVVGQGHLPVEPRADSSLGEIQHRFAASVGDAFRAGAITPIASGPNEGLIYVTAVPPIVSSARIFINESALTEKSAFWYGQKEHKPTEVIDHSGACKRSDVTSNQTRDRILVHEGPNLETNSHSYLMKKAGDDLLGPALEGIVARDSDFSARWDAAIAPVLTEMARRAGEADQINRVNFGCRFDYRYPSRKNAEEG